jgi:2-amino-4-hydroxy-6-hydroxymethyldihydropteridine diphosphokinase
VNAAHDQRVSAYVALGANLGDACATLMQAFDDLAKLQNTSVVRRSSLYRTAPIESSGPDYFNAVAEISTALSPQALLAALQALEQQAGRQRPYRNAPRTLDLDILLYGDVTLDGPDLVIPHPRMYARAFVLVPLAEIAPSRVSAAQFHAVANQTIVRVPPNDVFRAH